MITSSEFFKKTFFDIELQTPLQNHQINPNFNQINKTVLHRYSQFNSHENKNLQTYSNTKRTPKNNGTFQSTNTRFNDSYKQIQRQKKNYYSQKLQDQFTIDVTPWNQHSSLTPREMYDSKQNLSREREKIKSTISKYKFTRTIEQNEKDHANFIKSPRKNKKVNYILYDYGNRKSKEETRKKINLVKSIDLNKSYEQYLNHEIEFDKDFLFKSHAKVKTHNKQQPSNRNKNTSRQGISRILNEKSSEKQFTDDSLNKNLACSRYVDEFKQLKIDASGTHQSSKQEEMAGPGAKLNQKARLLEKGKILKFEMNRRIFKGTKITLTGITPIINSSLTERQKLNFEVSGNKTRKLQNYQKTD